MTWISSCIDIKQCVRSRVAQETHPNSIASGRVNLLGNLFSIGTKTARTAAFSQLLRVIMCDGRQADEARIFRIEECTCME